MRTLKYRGFSRLLLLLLAGGWVAARPPRSCSAPYLQEMVASRDLNGLNSTEADDSPVSGLELGPGDR